jgi:type I restriction enzyme S subunit
MPVSEGYDSSFLNYLHRTLYAIQLNVRSIKQTTGIQNLDSKAYLNEPVAFPPLPEQTAIVRFLDFMDRRIRRVVHARQRQIKLLEEYRQALIHQAVTGQIDVRTGKPYPAYKDSGVPWLGQVPEHWEVRRLKTAVDHINEQTSTKTDEDLYIALEHVESWTGRLLLPTGEAQFDSQVKRFRAGDVLFGKLRPYLAKVVRPKKKWRLCWRVFCLARKVRCCTPLPGGGSAIGAGY